MVSKSEVINKFTNSPNDLFLVDGVGAILSAFFLGVILTRFEEFFGMPLKVLYVLAAIPCFFACYDLLAFLRVSKKQQLFLRIIAFANIGYCILSLVFAIQHLDTLLTPGWLYIIGEIIIVMVLVNIEFKTAKKLESF